MRNEKGQFVKGQKTGFENNLKLGHGWNKGMKFPENSGENSATFTHGMSHSRFWTTFRNIMIRCNDINAINYHLYGGRGIKCLWHSFEEFRDDMYESYLRHIKEFGEKNTSIDRIDVNGDYEITNCRWATPKEQSRNTRKNRMIEFNGQKLCLSEWAEKIGIAEFTIRARFRYGWSIEEALTTKII